MTARLSARLASMSLVTSRTGRLLHSARQDLSARYQYYGHVATILLDVLAHRELGRVLHRPELRALAEVRPDLPRKYLWRCLSRRLTRRDRLAVMIAHYRFLSERVAHTLAAHLLESPQVLWERTRGDDRFTISLRYPRRLWDHEGELTLVFEMNAVPLYTLWFTVADGATFGRPERHVLFVGGVQGAIGRLELMKDAADACDDLAPRTVLLAAAAGLASALGVGAIITVGNDEHVTRSTIAPAQFRFDYDQFWGAMGGIVDGGFFALSVPLPMKPLDRVAATHRRRAHHRRLQRAGVAEEVCARVGETLFRE